MLLRAVAVRYADALYSLADKAGGLGKIEEDLTLISETVASHDGLTYALVAPTVATSVKHSILTQVFEKHVSETMLRFMYVLVDKKREEYLDTILEVFQERLREERGEVECHVTSAKALTSALRKDLEESLESFTGKKVQLVEDVDADLVAGMVVVVGDRVIDTSFRNQLREIEDRMSRVQ